MTTTRVGSKSTGDIDYRIEHQSPGVRVERVIYVTKLVVRNQYCSINIGQNSDQLGNSLETVTRKCKYNQNEIVKN